MVVILIHSHFHLDKIESYPCDDIIGVIVMSSTVIGYCDLRSDVAILDHDHYYDHKETWGFCCQCPACSEDRDEPIRLLLSQLKPRCADVH